jgi:membrane protein YqaA with SNARE-associated domain
LPNILKSLLHARNWVWALLKPLGPWGVFLAAALDGAGMPLPGAADAVMVAYVHRTPWLAWFYVLLAASGSALGCLVLYSIGSVGGEVLLARRMPKWKYEKFRRDFEDHPILTLALPSLMPPPFPFKAFILAAGAFAMRRTHFLGVIFIARLVRFGVLSVLTIRFGTRVFALFNTAFQKHPVLTGTVIVVTLGLALLVHKRRSNPPRESQGEPR